MDLQLHTPWGKPFFLGITAGEAPTALLKENNVYNIFTRDMNLSYPASLYS
jgi:hypothetical protein